jgi:hypothetical protein
VDNFYFQGVDNMSACGSANNGTMEGVKVAVPAAVGAPVVGTAYAAADNLIDAQYGVYSGEQWFVITLTKPSKFLKKFGWAGYIGYEGYEFLGNYGYLSAEIPAASSKPVLGKTNAGAVRQSKNLTKTIAK